MAALHSNFIELLLEHLSCFDGDKVQEKSKMILCSCQCGLLFFLMSNPD